VSADGIAPMFAMKRAGGTDEADPVPGTDPLAPTGTDHVVPTAPTGTDPAGTDWHRPAGTNAGTGTNPSVPVAPTTVGTSLVPVLAELTRASARVRLTRWTQSRIAEIADSQRRHRTFWHAISVFITRLPETRAETERHLESRSWLQEWMTGKLLSFCEWENIAWGHLVSLPGRSVMQLIEKVFFERQSRFWIAVLIILTVVLIRFASHL
jgi:hypothetical protein